MPNVKFVVEYHVVEAQPGRSLREIALEAGVNPNREGFLGLNCRGLGLCGNCKVWVKQKASGATSAPNLREKLWGMGDGRRLACQTRVLGDIEVTTFPGGADRLTAGRVIDPLPVRPETAEEAAKPAAAAGKPAAADKADKKPAKAADGAAPKPAVKADKKPDAEGAEAEAKPDAKPEPGGAKPGVKADKTPEDAPKAESKPEKTTDAEVAKASEGEAPKAGTEGKAEATP